MQPTVTRGPSSAASSIESRLLHVLYRVMHVLSCALYSFRADDHHRSRGETAWTAGPAATTADASPGIPDTADLSGSTGTGPLPLGTNTWRHRDGSSGLSQSEIALLPVRRFVGPRPPEATAETMAGPAAAAAAAAAASQSTAANPCPQNRSNSSSSGGADESRDGGTTCGSARGWRWRTPSRNRLHRDIAASSSASQATGTVPRVLAIEHSGDHAATTNTTNTAANNGGPDEGGGGAGRGGEKERDTGNGGGGRSTDETCAICLSGYVENCDLRVLTPCQHVFHPSCVDEWLKRRAVCPICKGTVTVPACAAQSGETADPPRLDDLHEGVASQRRVRQFGQGDVWTAIRAVTGSMTLRAPDGSGGVGGDGGPAGGARNATASPRGSGGSRGPSAMLTGADLRRGSEVRIETPLPDAGAGSVLTATVPPRGALERSVSSFGGWAAVTMWESQASDASLRVTHYVNPLFGHR